MYTNGHGGGCCGIYHLSDFIGGSICLDDLGVVMGKIRSVENEYQLDNQVFKEGKLVEVVLTDDQIRNLPAIVTKLRSYGFKCVSRFKNSSGTFCNVLHYVPEDLLEGSPF